MAETKEQLLRADRCVEQRIFFNADTGLRGDCLKCCLATLLGLEYEAVPHFASMGDRWATELDAWLAERGWQLRNSWYRVDENDPAKITGYTQGLWLATVKSHRTRPDGTHLSHMVVMHDREIAWDPHPDRDTGHLGFQLGQLLVPIDPAQFVHA